LETKETFFSQGSSDDLLSPEGPGKGPQSSRRAGKEATITMLSAGDFVGEESLASIPGLRFGNGLCR